MAGDWIKVRTVLPTDGRLKIVSRTCHATSVTALGALVTLWCFADAHADDDGVLIGYAPADVNSLVGLPGFCEALPSDWLDASGEWVKLPEYQEHNGTTAKTRAQATKRKRTERTVTNVPKMSRSDRDISVTREEKRREDIKAPVVPTGDEAAILSAYHSILPKCKAIAVLNPKRKKRIAAVVKLAKQTCADQGWPYEAEGFWLSYFSECAKDAWMRGDVPYKDNPNWKQSLEVLIAEDRFAGVMDTAIANMRARA